MDAIILPTATGRPALEVMRYYQQGEPLDRARIKRCFAALAAAGVCTTGWLC